MLCSRCNKNEATVFFKQILNNQVSQYHLCAACAQGEPIGAGPPIFDLLAGLSKPSTPARLRALQCASCGLRYLEFRESGYLGCPDCYKSFRAPLADVLKHIHGVAAHGGKAPPAAKADKDRRRRAEEAAQVREGLRAAIAQERFEEAARLRDRLRRLEQP